MSNQTKTIESSVTGKAIIRLYRSGKSIGYGVWSTVEQRWVSGGWSRPISRKEAYAAYEAI